MSIRDAISNAARQTLSSYLAPELVEQLTEEILLRVAPEMETTLSALSGFELTRPTSPARLRGATAGGKKAVAAGKGARATKAAAAGHGDAAAEMSAAEQEAHAGHLPAHVANHNGNGGNPTGAHAAN